jgi:uncharacterized protein
MKVAISGASGLVGTALCAALQESGDEVLRLVRRAPTSDGEVQWDAQRSLDADALEGVDAVVNLSGAGIADKRWTKLRKRVIIGSRVGATSLLANTIASMATPPKVFVSTSAVGFYGDRGAQRLTEGAASGSGFLAEVCRAWEAATQPAVDAGIRVVTLRVGVVLAQHGGALEVMKKPFSMGLGGPIGGGQQYMPWVALPDLVEVIRFALKTSVEGPLNGVTASVPQREFAAALGKALSRPAVLPAPAFAVRLAMGELADVALHGQNVVPQVLHDHDFSWRYATLDAALQHAVGTPDS